MVNKKTINYNNNSTNQPIPFLISTFDERYFIVDKLLNDINNLFDHSVVFLASEKKEYKNEYDNILFNHLKYPDKPRTDTLKNECQSWGHRLFHSLQHLKEKGNEYVIWLCDDTRINEVNYNYDLIEVMKKYKIDRFHLSNITTRLYKLDDFEGNLKRINPTSQYYATHQISCWNIDSLLKVTQPTDGAGKHEGEAGNRARNHKMLFTCHQPPIYQAMNNYREQHGGFSLKTEEEVNGHIEKLKDHKNFN